MPRLTLGYAKLLLAQHLKISEGRIVGGGLVRGSGRDRPTLTAGGICRSGVDIPIPDWVRAFTVFPDGPYGTGEHFDVVAE